MHDLDVFAESEPVVSRRSSISGSKLSEVIYGNDIDSVDVAIRASLVKFFLSPNVIGDFTHHCRVLRLYSRPLVAFQRDTFIISRRTPSDFVRQLADTQVLFLSIYYKQLGEFLSFDQDAMQIGVGIKQKPQMILLS